MKIKKTTFKKICKRCDEEYITNSRYSRVCNKCKLPKGGKNNGNKKL